MAERNFLAFDLGAESGRAVLGTLNGGKLSLAEKHRFANPTGRMNGHLQWNLLGQWEELKTGLRKTLSGTGAPGTIHGIGVDTWGVDFGLLNAAGEVLGNPVHYRDSRTDGMMERTFARVGREKVFQFTGIQFMQFNTLFQLMAMKEQNSAMLAAAKTLLFMPDLFHYLFTGERRAEYSIASTGQICDPQTRQWCVALLKQLDLPVGILPEIVPSGTVVGQVRGEIAKECSEAAAGISVIAPASHDTASAVAAVPAGDARDWCYISSGTWSLMGVELDRPLVNDGALKLNYTNEGGVGGTTRFLKNIMGLWLVQECRRQWVREGHEHSYAELTQMARRAEGFAAVVDPNYGPFLTPGEMPAKIERFCAETGQRAPGSRGEFVRTCLESLALTYRRTLIGLEELIGRRIGVIHIVGGGVQNELLNQMTADACERPVVAGPIEATAAGNILVQAMATGDVASLAAARAIVRDSFEVKRFEPGGGAKWKGLFEKYVKVVAE